MDMVLLGLTLTSVGVAIGMSVWLLAVVREERQRSAARVTALESELSRAPESGAVEPGPDGMARDVDVLNDAEAGPEPGVDRETYEDGGSVDERSTLPGVGLFGGTTGVGTDAARLVPMIVVGALLVGGVAAAFIVVGGSGEARSTTLVEGQVARPPLELTSLRHRRDGEDWSIVGLVRNPSSAEAAESVMAVAFLFDEQGAFLASGRTPLEFGTVGPGTESPFAITITTRDRVARYRIGFRTADGSVIRHVDRRDLTADAPVGEDADR